MDKIEAEKAFADNIGGRWPEYELSNVLMQDWIDLFKKFQADDISRAAKQYVLNNSQFKKPDLFKFKEILNSQCRVVETNKVQPDVWPKYFLQRESDDCTNWLKGTFMQIEVAVSSPDFALNLVHQEKKRLERWQEVRGEMKNCGGLWKVVVCNDRKDFSMLCQNRTEHATIRLEARLAAKAGKVPMGNFDFHNVLTNA